MRLALVLSSLTLGACSLGDPVQLAADPATSQLVALDPDLEDVATVVVVDAAFLPSSLTCVSDADPDAGLPQLTRVRITANGDGAQVWMMRGPQFNTHNGVWTETAGVDPGLIDATVDVFDDVVLVRGDGIDLAIDGTGLFRSAEVFGGTPGSSSSFAGALTCWDEPAIFGSPWGGIPSALPAHFDWNTGGCVDVDGAPALNDLPIEFVRETGLGDCADLRGQSLNGADFGEPDLWMSLQGSRLDGAKLFHAQLSGSFEGADLSELGFGSATITGSFDTHTRLPVGDVCDEIQSPWGGASIECTQ